MHAELLDCAIKLSCIGAGGSQPTQADLRRALSTAYYAAFHFVMQQCADLLTRDPGGQNLGRAWAQVYRSIKHANVRDACNMAANPANGFPTEIQSFAAFYPNMRRLREAADYQPERSLEFNPRHVVAKINEVDIAIQQFQAANELHRRAFAILVAVKRQS